MPGTQSWVSRDRRPRALTGKPLIFRFTPRGLTCPRLETPRSSRISSIILLAVAGCVGGESAGIDDPAAYDLHGMDEGQSVGVLADRAGGLVDQVTHRMMGQHQAVDFLKHELGVLLRRLASGPRTSAARGS